MIEVRDLSKKYFIVTEPNPLLRERLIRMWKYKPAELLFNKSKKEEFWALKNVSFTANKGDVIGIIGLNGAGKSTLLKILAKITEPTSGEAIIKGRMSSLLEVGTGFHPELTGRENVYLNGSILGMTKEEIDDRFEEIVDFSGVARFLDVPVKKYSSGMQVRLAFSVAAHLDSEILLIDEVLAVGDMQFMKKCIKKMEQLTSDSGRTLIIIGHNMDTIERLCTKCILLREGRIQKIGEAAEVINEYSRGGLELIENNYPVRKNRKGQGDIWLKQISINGKNIKSGDKLKIAIEYDSKFRENISGVRLYINIFDRTGACLFRMDNTLTADTIESYSPHGTIFCETGEVNISPGQYYCNVGIYKSGLLQDEVKNALYFQVNNNWTKYDFTPNGKNIPPIIIKHRFHQ